ncbi:MAG TPA: glycosyltransferase family 4 protein, partial [Candidatus Caenarcaniphilales bacterium]|nr:glycosyltransferase family 4 protein [Candidatus Caenarcaniphilales bacterium]
PVLPGGPPGYGGRWPEWPETVHEVAADELSRREFDVVLFQTRANWLEDQWQLLSERQRQLPRIYLEHDPPREHPTDTRHPVDDPAVLLIHVTHFNALMWDSRRSPTRVIEHGVTVPAGVRYTGELERGIAVVNNIVPRGRRLGADVFARVRDEADVPLDLIGMGADELGGLGEVRLAELPAFVARYRFFFNPIRYTSLGLAVCEAMLVGLPICGLATTEMVRVIEDGVSGYLDTNVEALVPRMRQLLADPELARHLGDGARRTARERFGIDRFARDWLVALEDVSNGRVATTRDTNPAATRRSNEEATATRRSA